MASYHINFLELRAAFLCLKAIRPPVGSHIRLVLDNSPEVGCLRRGGLRSPILNSVMRQIIHRKIRMQWFLSAEHLSGVKNVIADSLSRRDPVLTEWTLDEASFQLIAALSPKPEVDMFATCLNHCLPDYVSPMTDPGAVAVDALQQDWNRWSSIYLFPRVTLILKVLRMLTEFHSVAYLVAPDWPASHW